MADISGQECSFRFAAMGVAHGDEGFEDFGVGQRGGPAIGGENSGVVNAPERSGLCRGNNQASLFDDRWFGLVNASKSALLSSMVESRRWLS